jgi:hypothetical protein
LFSGTAALEPILVYGPVTPQDGVSGETINLTTVAQDDGFGKEKGTPSAKVLDALLYAPVQVPIGVSVNTGSFPHPTHYLSRQNTLVQFADQQPMYFYIYYELVTTFHPQTPPSTNKVQLAITLQVNPQKKQIPALTFIQYEAHFKSLYGFCCPPEHFFASLQQDYAKEPMNMKMLNAVTILRHPFFEYLKKTYADAYPTLQPEINLLPISDSSDGVNKSYSDTDVDAFTPRSSNLRNIQESIQGHEIHMSPARYMTQLYGTLITVESMEDAMTFTPDTEPVDMTLPGAYVGDVQFGNEISKPHGAIIYIPGLANPLTGERPPIPDYRRTIRVATRGHWNPPMSSGLSAFAAGGNASLAVFDEVVALTTSNTAYRNKVPSK